MIEKDVYYADCQCMLKRVNIKKCGYTKLYQKHITNSIGAKLVCIDNEFTLPTKIFTDSNSIKELLNGFLNDKNIVIK